MFTHFMYFRLKIAHSALTGNYRSDQAFTGHPCAFGDDRWMCLHPVTVLDFLSGRLCYHCANELESGPEPGCSRRRKEGNKSTSRVAPAPPWSWGSTRGCLGCQRLLSAGRQEQRGQTLCCALAGLGTRNEGGCKPSVRRGSGSRGPPRLLTHVRSGTAALGGSRAP